MRHIQVVKTDVALDLHNVDPALYLFTLTRRQFPIKPPCAMTINKSEGQTLKKVGIYLPQSVFTHGQLYVAMSKVKGCNDLQFALAPPSENSLTITSYTNNVVFKSALIL